VAKEPVSVDIQAAKPKHGSVRCRLGQRKKSSDSGKVSTSKFASGCQHSVPQCVLHSGVVLMHVIFNWLIVLYVLHVCCTPWAVKNATWYKFITLRDVGQL